MKLNIISQIIHHYSQREQAVDPADFGEFPTESPASQVEDPLGGEEGITLYDRFNLDQDYDTTL